FLFHELTIEPPTTNQSTNHPEICHPQVCINKAQIACGTVDHTNQYKYHQPTSNGGKPKPNPTFETRTQTFTPPTLRRWLVVLFSGSPFLSVGRWLACSLICNSPFFPLDRRLLRVSI